jgi:hypothetical protein
VASIGIAVAEGCSSNHVTGMCGRVIQSSAPVKYGIVDGLNVRDSRVHNYPPRWNGAPNPGEQMRPFPAEPMHMWPISARVNKPENDDPSIVEPIA